MKRAVLIHIFTRRIGVEDGIVEEALKSMGIDDGLLPEAPDDLPPDPIDGIPALIDGLQSSFLPPEEESDPDGNAPGAEAENPNADEEEPEESDVWMEGELEWDAERVCLSWVESDLTGLEGSVANLCFDVKTPGLVTLLRSGTVGTALVFEAGQRHQCVYETPYSSFDVTVATRRVRNEIFALGKLSIDYQIEIHGARTERVMMDVTLSVPKGS